MLDAVAVTIIGVGAALWPMLDDIGLAFFARHPNVALAGCVVLFLIRSIVWSSGNLEDAKAKREASRHELARAA